MVMTADAEVGSQQVCVVAGQATTAYEEAREKVARFIGASPREVVFTKNASEAVNLVAHAWGSHNLKPGDEVSRPLALTVASHPPALLCSYFSKWVRTCVV